MWNDAEFQMFRLYFINTFKIQSFPDKSSLLQFRDSIMLPGNFRNWISYSLVLDLQNPRISDRISHWFLRKMNTWEKGGGRKANKEIKFASVWREWTGIPERKGSELFLWQHGDTFDSFVPISPVNPAWLHLLIGGPQLDAPLASASDADGLSPLWLAVRPKRGRSDQR